MSFIGDLERLVATSLYPLRVPIGIGLAVALVALLILARRRGWLAAARRHPARATVLVVAFLAVALPAGWYLGSPLFIRTALVEPPPAAASTRGPVATTPPSGVPPAGMMPTSATPSGPPATPALSPTAPPTLSRSGTFTGADDFHFGSGTARLFEASPGSWTVRFEDFSVRNGPDLFVYLSPSHDGYADGAVELARLKATDGSFNTAVPPGTDVEAMRSVIIWCKQFAVLFATAPLE